MSEEWRPQGEGTRLPAHVTTPLLTRIIEGSLDEDYRQVAHRKAAQRQAGARGSGAGRKPPTGRPQLIATLVIAVFGVLVTTAAVQTSQDADITSASRETLVARAQEGRADVTALQERIADLQAENIAAQDELDALTGRLQTVLAQQVADGGVTGFNAVSGPGVRVVVTDPATVTDANDLVRDVDLARLTNGLWQAGAEAIAINGQRLTVLTGIRNVGVAPHVNGRPLRPPYVVDAIGDTDTLQANLLQSSLGARFFDVADQLGFGLDVQNVDRLELPALRGPRLHHVERGTQGKPGMDDEEANP